VNGLERFAGATFRRASLYDRPALYDVDYAGYLAEDRFYRHLVQERLPAGRTYVEIGAGTGRLCLSYAASGVRVHAVEPARAMRDALCAKAKALGVLGHSLTVEAGNAASFTGPADASTGIVAFPFNGMLHLETRAAVDAFLQTVRACLPTDGLVAFDVTSPPWEEMSEGGRPFGRVDSRIDPRSGVRVWTCDSCRYDENDRVMTTTYRFLAEGSRRGHDLSIRQRVWTFQQLLAALDDNGFVIDTIFGDVDLAPYDEASPRLLVAATRHGG